MSPAGHVAVVLPAALLLSTLAGVVGIVALTNPRGRAVEGIPRSVPATSLGQTMEASPEAHVRIVLSPLLALAGVVVEPLLAQVRVPLHDAVEHSRVELATSLGAVDDHAHTAIVLALLVVLLALGGVHRSLALALEVHDASDARSSTRDKRATNHGGGVLVEDDRDALALQHLVIEVVQEVQPV